MRKNLKVLQINGFRGILFVLFVTTCLAAGFIAFPAFLTMNIWNYLTFKLGSLLSINFLQGLLLWAIIAVSVYLINKHKFVMYFSSKQELNEDEVRAILAKIKTSELPEAEEKETINSEK